MRGRNLAIYSLCFAIVSFVPRISLSSLVHFYVRASTASLFGDAMW